MDLTKKPSAKKWYLRPAVFLLLAVIALGLILWLVTSRGCSAGDDEDGYGEDQLPAIKVTVLNGCGFDQLATEFADMLSKKNIDVLSVGNTSRPVYDKSIIVMRKEDKQDLARLQKMTGIKRWTSALDEYHSAQFDIIVGRDFEHFMN